MRSAVQLAPLARPPPAAAVVPTKSDFRSDVRSERPGCGLTRPAPPGYCSTPALAHSRAALRGPAGRQRPVDPGDTT